MRQKLKSFVLPISILGGIIFHEWIGYLQPLSLLLIFMMLTITYCKIKPTELQIKGSHWIILVAQLLMSIVTYFLLLPVDNVVAIGVSICVFIPTATAAPVVTRMLGGNVTFVAVYSLLCNLIIAFIAPILLALIGVHSDTNFIDSFVFICKKVIPLLIFPMLLAFGLQLFFKQIHSYLANHQSISFYLWSVALFIVVGNSVSFVIERFSNDILWTLICLVIGSLIVCILQFYVGNKIGNVVIGDSVAGAQSFAQKNTILAIWMCLTYLDPLTSIGPASYMAWHNIFNSWQILKYKNS